MQLFKELKKQISIITTVFTFKVGAKTFFVSKEIKYLYVLRKSLINKTVQIISKTLSHVEIPTIIDRLRNEEKPQLMHIMPNNENEERVQLKGNSYTTESKRY